MENQDNNVLDDLIDKIAGESGIIERGKQTVVSLGPIYSVLLKGLITVLSVIALPSLGWFTWVTHTNMKMEAFMEAGGRFTQHDGENLKYEVTKDTDNKVMAVAKEFQKAIEDDKEEHRKDLKEVHEILAKLPPEEFRERIKAVEQNQQLILQNQQRLFTMMEYIQGKRPNP